jgi:hypothetical protein
MLQSQAPKTPYKVCNGKELSNFLSQRVYKFDKEIPYCMDYTSVGQLFNYYWAVLIFCKNRWLRFLGQVLRTAPVLLIAFLILRTDLVFQISEKIWLGGFQH